MEFNAESVAAEVDKQFAGVTITDGPNGPINIKASVRLSKERRKMINALGEQLDKAAKAPKIILDGETVDDPDFEPDLDRIEEIQIDALALRCDEPQDLRDWLVDKDPAVLVVLQKALNKEADQGETGAQ
jgi:hypothetical protein